jgi:hypothetical protein
MSDIKIFCKGDSLPPFVFNSTNHVVPSGKQAILSATPLRPGEVHFHVLPPLRSTVQMKYFSTSDSFMSKSLAHFYFSCYTERLIN